MYRHVIRIEMKMNHSLLRSWIDKFVGIVRRQPKAEWTARLGTVRLSSSSPWQQERRIVGMVKSPVEGSTMVLLKLDRPVTAFSDFVRPVCLPSSDDLPLNNASHCNTLGWAKNRKFTSFIIHINPQYLPRYPRNHPRGNPPFEIYIHVFFNSLQFEFFLTFSQLKSNFQRIGTLNVRHFVRKFRNSI